LLRCGEFLLRAKARPFFGSNAPPAFFRTDRQIPAPARADAVKTGRSLISFAKARTFLLVVVHILASGHFFCSTAPQAFFRPNRNLRTPARAGAVKAGRRSEA
jgi:hypothetical protein